MKKIRLFLLLLMTALLPLATFGQETLTVNDGTTTNSYVPFYALYADEGARSQFIIPSTELEAMTGGEISSMVFYSSSANPDFQGDPEFNVYMMEVENNVFSGTTFEEWSALTNVYSGSVSVSDYEMVIEFDNGFMYNGGNLLIGFDESETSVDYASFSWYGVSQSGSTALYQYMSWGDWTSVYSATFLPKVTFTYTAGTPSSCARPTAPISNVTATTATFSWTAGGTETSWNFEYSTDNEVFTSVAVTGEPTVTIGVEPQTTYWARVQANCGDEPSAYLTIPRFTTPCAAYVVDATHPFNEDFTDLTSTTFPPVCWKQERTEVGSSSSFYGTDYANGAWTVNTYTQGTGSNPPMAQLRDTRAGSKHNLVTTPLSMAAGNYMVSVNVYRSASGTSYPTEGVNVYVSKTNDLVSEGNEAVDLGFISRNYETASTVNADIIGVESESGWYTYELPFTVTAESVYYVIFEGRSQYGSSTYMDDVAVFVAPTCRKPTGVQVVEESLTARSVTIDWTDNTPDPQDGYLLIVNDTIEIPVSTHPHPLSGLTPETRYTVKVQALCGGGDNSEVSNEISFTTPMSCYPVTALTVIDSTITTTSATIKWNRGRDEEMWYVNYNGTELLAEDTVITLDDLTSATSYTVKVKSVCDIDDSSRTVSVSFNTKCEPTVVTNNLLFSENFNSLTEGIPMCWDNSIGNTTYDDYKWNYDGNGAVRFNSYNNSSNNTNELRTPVLDLTQTTDPKLSFKYKYPGYSYNSYANFSVFISIDGGNTYNSSVLSEGHIDDWTDTTIVLENLTDYSQVVIVFKGTSDCGYNDDYIYLDDVEVSGTPTCFRPTEVTASEITANTAVISWTDNNENAPENGWTVSYFDGENTVTTEVTDTTAPISGLTGNTTYTVQVRANCGTNDESAWNDVTFTTPCDLVSADDYTENFDSYTDGVSSYAYDDDGILPSCWDYIYTGEAYYSDYRPHIYNGSYSPTANNNCVVMTAGLYEEYDYWDDEYYYYDYGMSNYAVMPGFESLVGKELSFATAMNDDEEGTLTVGYVTSLEPSSFTELETVPSNYYYYSDTRYATHVVNVSSVPANARIAFRWMVGEVEDSYSPYSCTIDDIKIDDIPDCLPPTTVNVDTVTATTATLSWNDVNEEMPEGWTVQYTYDTVTRTATSDTTFIILSDLVPETHYTAKVKTNCNPVSESAWSAEVTFETTPTCLRPTELAYSELTATTVTLDWTAGDAEEQWILVLNDEEILVNDNHLVIDTLRPTTSYSILVRAYCSADDTSYNSDGVSFRTPCVAEPAEDYTENFSGYTAVGATSPGSMPDCWDYISTGSNKPHVFNGTGTYGPTPNDTCLIMPARDNYGAVYAIMPPLTDPNYRQIKFATAMTDANGVFSFGYIENATDASTFTLMETLPVNLVSDTAHRYTTRTVELVNIPATARLAFKWESNASAARYACIDDIEFIEAPDCMKPTELEVSDITAHTATLDWRENNPNGRPENGWILRVNDGTADRYIAVTDTTAASWTFDDLTATTDYTVSVSAVCNANDTSLWSVVAEFSTPCESVDTLVEDFESYEDDDFPDCWTKIGNGTVVVESSYYAHEGDNFLHFSGVTNGNMVAMPPFTSYNGMTITFYTRPESISYSYCGSFEFGYVTDLTRANTFHVLETYRYNDADFTDGYAEKEIELSEVPAGAYLAFNHKANIYNNYYWFVDDINVHVTPSCLKPVALTVPDTSITTTTAWVHWTDRNDTVPTNGWTLLLNDSIEIHADTNPFELTGLSASSTYTVKVQANCDALDASDWSREVTFYTECGIASAEGFSENFDGYTASSYTSTTSGILPHCWDYIFTGTSTYGYEPHIYNGSSYTPTSDNNAVIMVAGYSYYGNSYVVLPEFTSLSGKQVVFATAMSSTTEGELTVGYVSSLAASAFTALETVPSNYYYGSNRYVSHEVNVSMVPAGSRLAFKWSCPNAGSYSSAYCCIDDIVIEDLPSCLKPVNVEVIDTSITQTSVTIQWTDQNDQAPANGWTIVLNGTTEVAAPTNPFTLTDLNPSSSYTVQVIANCDSLDMSNPSNEITFHTECGTIVLTNDNPFTEDFNSLTSGIPACWDNSEGTTTYDSYKWNYYSTGATGSCVRFDSYSNSTGNTNMLKTPVLDLTQMTAIPQLTFNYMNSGGGDYSVYISTDGGATYTTALATGLTAGTWTMDTISLEDYATSDQVVIVFKGTSNYSYYYLYLDDVTVGPGRIPCAAPTNVAIDSNYHVTWDGDAPLYQVLVMEGTDTLLVAPSSSHTYVITGLEEGTHATVSVRAVCSPGDYSEWSEAIPFTFGTDTTDTIGIVNYRILANIFPNPTTGNVTVESNAIGADLTVFDMFGKLMMTTKVTEARTELNFSSFAPGVYMVRIANSTAITTVKVVKK